LKTNRIFTVHLSLLATCFLWAVSFIAVKVALVAVPPFTLVTLRLLISALCFMLWFLIRGRRPIINGRAIWKQLFILSLFGTGLHYGLQTMGLQYTTASNASLYAVTGPISIILIAAFYLGEKLSFQKILGIFLAIIGVLVVMGLETLKAFDFKGHLLGDVLVMVSIAMWGIFTVYGKRLMKEMDALEVIALTTFIGAAWMVPIGWAEGYWRGFALSSITLSAWLAIAYLGVTCSFLATLFYFLALGKTEAQKVGVYCYTIPPMTYVVAALYLDERIGLNLLIGSVLVLAGVYLTERG
jgi:drug/metabolite transporter (DMT)-like permease